MDGQDVYTKTEKAMDEIQNRTYKLAQKMRSLLIMIDGTKAVSSYVDFSKVLGDVTSMLIELEQQGFIKKSEQAVSTPQQPEQPAEKTAETTLGLSEDQKKEQLDAIKKLVDSYIRDSIE
jgi:hypothetical protein